jgi:hypothetical protein
MQWNIVNKTAANDTVAPAADTGEHARSLYFIIAFEFIVAFKVRTFKVELVELPLELGKAISKEHEALWVERVPDEENPIHGKED